MILIYINLSIAVFAFVLWWLNAEKAGHIFKTRYPELEIPRRHWSERTLAYIEGFLMCICPIINIVYALIFITNSDEICERTVAKVYKKCMEEK